MCSGVVGAVDKFCGAIDGADDVELELVIDGSGARRCREVLAVTDLDIFCQHEYMSNSTWRIYRYSGPKELSI